MHHFFVSKEEIGEEKILLRGENFHHLHKVLRGQIGEKILISDGEGVDYQCEIQSFSEDEAVLSICFREEPHELPAKIILLQGLPKGENGMGWKEAFSYVKDCDFKLLPYENERGVVPTREILGKMEEAVKGKKDCSVALCIGPEGGFTKEEVEAAMGEGFLPISLGKRILRTETAAITALNLIMMQLE